MNKYHAVRVPCGDHTHDSRRERDRCFTLTQLERLGEITALERQPRYVFEVNGWRVGSYRPDFAFVTKGGVKVVEDVKSAPTKTEAYRIRRRLMRACYGIEVREVE